jgi:hypothetical protein
MDTPNNSPRPGGKAPLVLFFATALLLVAGLLYWATNQTPPGVKAQYTLESLTQADNLYKGTMRAIHDNNIQVLRSGSLIDVNLYDLVTMNYLKTEDTKQGATVSVQREGEQAVIRVYLVSDSSLSFDTCTTFASAHIDKGTLTCRGHILELERRVPVVPFPLEGESQAAG